MNSQQDPSAGHAMDSLSNRKEPGFGDSFYGQIGPIRDSLAALVKATLAMREHWGSGPDADSPAMAEIALEPEFAGQGSWGKPTHSIMPTASAVCSSSLSKTTSEQQLSC